MANDVEDLLLFLKEKEEEVEIGDDPENLVLLLGLTGTGKTTLVHFLSGNGDLQAVEENSWLNDFVIVGGNSKICNATVDSCTMVPDRVVDRENGVVFYDNPGLSDTRSPKHDIAVSYLINQVLKSASGVKLVFAINHHSVRRGLSRSEFLLFLKNALKLVKNFDHLKNSMALVVTKVENFFKTVKGVPSLVPDEVIVENGIVPFLKEVIDNFESKIPSSSPDDVDFLTRAVRFMNIFLQKDENGYSKIGLFRRPFEGGALLSSEMTAASRKGLRDLIFDRLVYSTPKPEYFGHTISADTRVYLFTVADQLNSNVANDVSVIGHKVVDRVKEFERSVKDIDQLAGLTKTGLGLFIKMKTNTYEGPKDLIKDFVSIMNELKVPSTPPLKSIVVNFLLYDRFIDLISAMVSGTVKVHPLIWVQPLDSVVSYLQFASSWYDFINTLKLRLSSYETRKNIVSSSTYQLKNHLSTYSNTDDPVWDSLEQFWRDVIVERSSDKLPLSRGKLDRFKLKFLIDLLNVDIFETCSSSNHHNKLVIAGHVVKLSNAISIFKSASCGRIDILEIHALDRIYFDAHFRNEKKLQVSIISPIWEVVNSASVVLDGTIGKTRYPSTQRKTTVPGFRGADGLPGRAGGPAGSFLGIGRECINCAKLLISANGGRGGAGQGGGDGADGQDGRETTANSYSTVINALLFHVYHENVGFDGQPGGSGGHGGSGGRGGSPGQISLFFNSRNKESAPQTTAQRGRDGEDGVGGLGGKGGEGRHRIISRTRLLVFTKNNGYVVDEPTFSPAGLNGQTGFNNENIETPENGSTLKNPSHSINAFKSYLRENFNNTAIFPASNEFLHTLETDSSILKFYDTMGLIDDFKRLENQFHSLNKHYSLSPSYKYLLERINNYSVNPHKNEYSVEYRKLMAYLYASTLSKICRFDSINNELVINIQYYLSTLLEDVRDMNNLKAFVARYGRKEKYKTSIENKINFVREFIANEVTLDLERNVENVGAKLEALINETLHAKDVIIALKNKRLEETATKRAWSTVISFAGMVLEFLGLGLAPSVIPASNLVKESLGLDGKANGGDRTTGGIRKQVEGFIDDLSANVKEKAKFFVKLLETVKGNTQTMPNSDIKANILSKIDSTRERVRSEMEKNQFDDEFIERIYNAKEEITAHLDSALSSGNGGHLQSILQESRNILSLSEQLFGFAEDESVIKKASQLALTLEDQQAVLDKFEKRFYRAIVPLCRGLRQIVNNVKEHDSSQQRALLYLRKLKVQSAIQDIRDEIDGLALGFNGDNPLLKTVDKLNFGLTYMIQLFDRIHEYLDWAELADYIADITSPKAEEIRINNDELKNEFRQLQYLLHSNLILSDYEKAMSSFRLHVFPFAQSYLSGFNLPPHLEGGRSTENIIDSVANQLKVMEKQLRKDDLVITGNRDQNIYRNIPFSLHGDEERPFFSWKYEAYSDSISKLMSGEEVVLFANVAKGSEYSAVKFNEVGIQFVMRNSTLTNAFINALRSYEIQMVHMGTSSYRCGNKYYVMSHEPLVIRHSSLTDEKGHFFRSNSVYKKITENTPLLSPYTMWKIKLLPLSTAASASLRRFRHEIIDVDLEGFGQFALLDETVCNDDLEKFYKVDKSLDELEFRKLLNKRTSEKVVIEYRHDRKRRSTTDSFLGSIFHNVTQYMANPFSRFGATRTVYRRFGLSPSHFSPPEISQGSEGFRLSGTVDYSTADAQSNLMLMDLIVRKMNKTKAFSPLRQIESVNEGAHDLAYRAHVPRAQV